MTMVSAIANVACEARIEALRSELGATLAARIIDSEAAEFLWEARVRERYLGQHIEVGLSFDLEETELSRIAMLTFLDGRWHAGACLVDGEGSAVDLLWRQGFECRSEAEAAFDRAA